MRYVKLGRSGLDVSLICIGSMGYGDPSNGHPTWPLGEETSRPLIRHAAGPECARPVAQVNHDRGG
jgi:1-deoxyxylulose-5-phosphate synthase